MMLKVISAMLASLLLLACSSQATKSGSDTEVETGPASLPSFEERVDIDVVWRRSLGNGSGTKNTPLRPAVSGKTV